MTDAQRIKIIQDLIKKHTAIKIVDKKTARKSLIDEGIYTKSGALKVEFGGNTKSTKSAA